MWMMIDITPKITIVPDVHACSFNRVREIRIEQDANVVVINEWDVEKIVEMLKDD